VHCSTRHRFALGLIRAEVSPKLETSPAVIGIDIGKNSFHIVGQKSARGAIVLRQK
jgi:hypothetical protein